MFSTTDSQRLQTGGNLFSGLKILDPTSMSELLCRKVAGAPDDAG